jgi:hypothetical protein
MTKRTFFRFFKALFLAGAVFLVFAGLSVQNTLNLPDKDKGAFSDRKDLEAQKNWENSQYRKARTSRERKFDKNGDGYLDSIELREYRDRYDRR